MTYRLYNKLNLEYENPDDNWFFILFILKLNLEYENPDDNWFFIIILGLSAILTWISIFQYFPLAVRRLHDLNASGWYVLVSFITFGQLLIPWLMFKKGAPGPNKYGKSSDNYNERDTTLNYNLALYGAERKDKLQLFVPKSTNDIELYQLSMRKQDLIKMLIAEKTRLQDPNIEFTKASCQFMIDAISDQIKLIANQISSLIEGNMIDAYQRQL